ncbi:hypothetical protein [Natrarchaeobius halalkaliphilus]|uniref:hypothetical protein n=1 Tax=Natrarchaeobius halalkaliphilus TaxID=1679091 RepID=UPI001FB44669|nr:hypothetical protein [Natrarchaeobius halalkaliphilus]
MSDPTRLRRRSTLCALAGAGTAMLSAVASTEARAEETDRDRTDSARAPPDQQGDLLCDADRYVAVVDRIVDGEHVVLLLEEDGTTVDQHVASVDEFDTIAEGDILIVLIGDDELLWYRIVPERPSRE